MTTSTAVYMHLSLFLLFLLYLLYLMLDGWNTIKNKSLLYFNFLFLFFLVFSCFFLFFVIRAFRACLQTGCAPKEELRTGCANRLRFFCRIFFLPLLLCIYPFLGLNTRFRCSEA